jgi:hypothetical protein
LQKYAEQLLEQKKDILSRDLHTIDEKNSNNIPESRMTANSVSTLNVMGSAVSPIKRETYKDYMQTSYKPNHFS